MKARLLITLIVYFFVYSCSMGMNEEPDPFGNPETSAIAYLDAIVSGSCLKAASYWAPSKSEFGYSRCLERYMKCKFIRSRLDEVVAYGLPDNVEPSMGVELNGYFLRRCENTGEEYFTDNITIWYVDQDDKWYIVGTSEK